MTNTATPDDVVFFNELALSNNRKAFIDAFNTIAGLKLSTYNINQYIVAQANKLFNENKALWVKAFRTIPFRTDANNWTTNPGRVELLKKYAQQPNVIAVTGFNPAIAKGEWLTNIFTQVGDFIGGSSTSTTTTTAPPPPASQATGIAVLVVVAVVSAIALYMVFK